MTVPPHFQRLLNDVRDHGWHHIFVPDEGPGFGYTIGLWRSYRHAELVLVGLPSDVVHAVFWAIVREILKGRRFEVGPTYDEILEGYECCFRSVHRSQYDDHFGQAIRFHEGYEFPVLQCVYPDRKGLFPWEKGCTPEFVAMQTLLDRERPPS
jgi:hypothetical protein